MFLMDVSYRHDPLSGLLIKIFCHLEHYWLVKHGNCPLVRIVHLNLRFWFNCCWTTCILFIKIIYAKLLVLWCIHSLIDWLLVLNLLFWFIQPALGHVIRWCNILNISKFRVRPTGFSLSKCLRCVKATTLNHNLLLLWVWLVVLHVWWTWKVALKQLSSSLVGGAVRIWWGKLLKVY